MHFIRRHPLTAFFLWFFTVGQAFAFTPVVLDVPVPRELFIVASTLFGLFLPVLVITRIVDGADGLRALWRRTLQVRAGLGWYALALLAVPLLSAALVAGLQGPPAAPVAAALAGNFALPLLLSFAPNNLWEEAAWTGFVQRRLQDRRGPAVAAILTAVMFALQHISLVAGTSLANAAVLMTLLAVLAVPFRFFAGWLYNRTGSLFLVGLAHAAGDAVAGGSGFQDGLLARLYPDSGLSTMAHLLAFALVGLVVVVATRGRLGLPRSPAPPPLAAPLRAIPGGRGKAVSSIG
jgi:membrane protease YdiL (CAAX protease family)